MNKGLKEALETIQRLENKVQLLKEISQELLSELPDPMPMEEQRVFVDALCTFGPDKQMLVLIEEMAELTKEIIKYKRGRDNLREIAEEMTDVRIMLDQMTLHFQNGGLQQQIRLEKVERLKHRVAFEVEEDFDAAEND